MFQVFENELVKGIDMKKKIASLFSVLIIILMVFSTFTPAKVTAQSVEPEQEVSVD